MRLRVSQEASPGPLLGSHSSRLRPFQHCPGPPQLGCICALMVVGEEGAHSPLAPGRLLGESSFVELTTALPVVPQRRRMG